MWSRGVLHTECSSTVAYICRGNQNVKKKLYFGTPSQFGWKLASEMTSSEGRLSYGNTMTPTQRADTDDDRTLSTPMADIVKGMAKAVSQLQVGEKKRYKFMCKLLLLICRSLK
jgi:hypothetical protein